MNTRTKAAIPRVAGALAIVIVSLFGYFVIDSSRSWIWIGLVVGFAVLLMGQKYIE